MHTTQSLEKLSNITDRLSEAQQQVAPVAAKTIVQAVKNETVSNDLLQLVGIIAGRGLKAEDLVIAIRNELENNREGIDKQ